MSPLPAASLIGPAARQPSTDVNDLITGDVGGVAAAALSPASPPELTASQSSGLQGLRDFISSNDNISSEESAELIAQLDAIESLMRLTNGESVGRDPVFALVGSNSDSLGGLPAGSLVNGLF